MAIYCISFALKKKGKDYKPFYAQLEKDGWAHILDTTCLVFTVENAVQLQERLRPELDVDDGLFICRVHKNEYSGWATQPYWDWIKKNI